MANSKHTPGVVVTSPPMVFGWTALTEASTTHNAEGVWEVKGTFVDPASDEVKAFLAKVDQLHEAAAEWAKANWWDKASAADRKKKGGGKSFEEFVKPWRSDELDEDTGEETGNYEFGARRVASGKRKKDDKPWTFTLPLFDVHGKKIEGKRPSIWSGTVGRISFEARPFTPSGSWDVGCGLQRKLRGVQIIKLVSGGDTAESLGFQDEGEGYEHKAVAEDSGEGGSAGVSEDNPFAGVGGGSAGEEDF